MLGAGCEAKFVGPYPCAAGYASCVDAAQSLCETRIVDDSLNCGACGTTCGVGAACTDAACGAAAPTLAALSGTTNGQPALALNSTAIFWAASSTIWTLPIGGGTATTVATNVFSCGSGSSFAVDDDNLYFWSSGNGAGTGLTKVSLSSGASTLLFSSSGQSGCPSLAVDATNIYETELTENGGSVGQLVVSEIPVGGGTSTRLATLQSTNSSGLAITATDAIVAVQPGSGSTSFAVVPLAGGAPRMIDVDPTLGGGGTVFATDDSNIYFLSGGCPCGNTPSGTEQATGQVAKIPLDGSPGSVLARFTGVPESIAVDGDEVYWSTDVAVWKVPAAGGQGLAVAGNLGGGSSSYVCNGCSLPGVDVAIALGPTSVVIDDGNVGVDALLKVSR